MFNKGFARVAAADAWLHIDDNDSEVTPDPGFYAVAT